MLELIMPGQKDWLGNPAPTIGCLVVGARYTFSVAREGVDAETGTVDWEWDLHGTTYPVDGTFFICSEQPVRLPVSASIHLDQRNVMRQVALACAQAAFAQLVGEAALQQERYFATWPTRDTWPEDEYDGYNPARRSFESLRVALERTEWVTGVGRFLREGKEE